jgi:hypothetical protein
MDDDDFYAPEGGNADTQQQQPEAAPESDPKPKEEDEDLEEGEEEDEVEDSDSVRRVGEFVSEQWLTSISGHRYHHREKRWQQSSACYVRRTSGAKLSRVNKSTGSQDTTKSEISPKELPPAMRLLSLPPSRRNLRTRVKSQVQICLVYRPPKSTSTRSQSMSLQESALHK